MKERPANTIHYTELGPAPPGVTWAVEYETFRREIERLLAEGHEGKFALIKGARIVGLVQTEEEAWAWADSEYPGHGLIKQILEYEPLLRLSPRHQRWLDLNSQLRPTG